MFPSANNVISVKLISQLSTLKHQGNPIKYVTGA